MPAPSGTRAVDCGKTSGDMTRRTHLGITLRAKYDFYLMLLSNTCLTEESLVDAIVTSDKRKELTRGRIVKEMQEIIAERRKADVTLTADQAALTGSQLLDDLAMIFMEMKLKPDVGSSLCPGLLEWVSEEEQRAMASQRSVTMATKCMVRIEAAKKQWKEAQEWIDAYHARGGSDGALLHAKELKKAYAQVEYISAWEDIAAVNVRKDSANHTRDNHLRLYDTGRLGMENKISKVPVDYESMVHLSIRDSIRIFPFAATFTRETGLRAFKRQRISVDSEGPEEVASETAFGNACNTMHSSMLKFMRDGGGFKVERKRFVFEPIPGSGLELVREPMDDSDFLEEDEPEHEPDHSDFLSDDEPTVFEEDDDF